MHVVKENFEYKAPIKNDVTLYDQYDLMKKKISLLFPNMIVFLFSRSSGK